MRILFFVMCALPFLTTAQTTDFHQLSGEYFTRSGSKAHLTYKDKNWDDEPISTISFETDGFFHSMDYSEEDANRVGGQAVFIMAGLYYLIELEPGVLAKINATPTWSLDGKDRIADVFARKKETLAKWTDEAINQQLVKFTKK
jgi:hypothetical protein